MSFNNHDLLGLSRYNHLNKLLGLSNSTESFRKALSPLNPVLNSSALQAIYKTQSLSSFNRIINPNIAALSQIAGTSSLSNYSAVGQISKSIKDFNKFTQMNNAAISKLFIPFALSDKVAHRLSSLWGLSEALNKNQDLINKTSLKYDWYKEVDWETLSKKHLENEFDVKDISINPDGSIIAGSEYFTREEIKENISNINKRISESENKTETLNSLINESAMKNDLSHKKSDILQYLSIILNILLFIFTMVPHSSYSNIAYSMSDFISKNKTQLIREFHRNPEDYFGGINFESPSIWSYKFVSTDELPIRVDHSTKSRNIGTLVFGDAIIVIRKKRNWSLIKSLDENKQSIQGWTFTRYLKDIKSKNKRS